MPPRTSEALPDAPADTCYGLRSVSPVKSLRADSAAASSGVLTTMARGANSAPLSLIVLPDLAGGSVTRA